jgi:hypothetical protein
MVLETIFMSENLTVNICKARVDYLKSTNPQEKAKSLHGRKDQDNHGQ